MTGAVELYVINLDGSGLQQLTHDGTENIFPRWSPDGTQILFSTLFIGGRFLYHHVATIRPDGTGRKLLTDALFDDYQAEYTTDGKEIVFGSTRRNLISALWRMSSNGSNRKQITEAALEAGASDLAPDGRRLVFWSQWNTELPGSFWLADLDGKHLMQIRTSDQLAGFPVFSPDGNKIVFNGGPPNANPGDIAVMNSDGSGVKVILSCPEGCALPDWGAKP
jgi:Tol biopolymer transport system component